jgi:hypothetical protein
MMLKKIATISMVSVSALALSGCLTLPGEFTSEAVINADGTYAFSYSGDVQIITLAMMMAEAGKASANREFTPYCYGPEGSSLSQYGDAGAIEISSDAAAEGAAAYDAAVAAGAAAAATDAAASAEVDYVDPYAPRDCTAEELAAQREEFDASIAREKQEAKEMGAMLGGIDPTDPETIADFTDRLERQRGWESVEWVKGGTFKVVYKTNGVLNDNFGFPLIADVPTGQPFLTIHRWDDNSVHVSAPGFSSGDASGMGSLGMMGAMFGASSGKGPSQKEMDELGIKNISGTFTVRTNGTVRTNNTETGPASEGGMQVMRWKVGGTSSTGAPATLIQL